jgi:hypothetical protein
MSDEPLNRSQSRILNTGLGIGMAGFFQRKLGRQALVLLDFLTSTDGSGSYRGILHRFTETEGFASDSTVRRELDRLERKGIVAIESQGDDRKVSLTSNFKTACTMFDIDVTEILRLYFDPQFIRCAPIFHGRMFSDKIPPFAFVLMPFAKEFDEIYGDHIVPTVEAYVDHPYSDHFLCRRADQVFEPRAIMETVWKCLVTCDVVISDLSTKNANVFYETGIAHTLGKPTILLSRSIEDVPFDLRHLNVIVYEPSYRGCLKLRESLGDALRAVLPRRTK